MAPGFEEFVGRNVLESLKFHMTLERYARCNIDRADWEILDKILSKDGGFPFLRRVEITVVLGEDDLVHDELEEDLWDIGTNHFPLLRNCDGLTFLFEVIRGTQDYTSHIGLD
jgi:hypothetical protein